MTSRLNVASIRKQRGSLVYLAYDRDMLSMGVCTTRQWLTSGRLVQELNVCTEWALCSLLSLGRSSRLAPASGKLQVT